MGLNGIEASAVNFATLQLYYNSSTLIVEARRALTDWEESEATWNQPKNGSSWATPGGQEGVDYTSSGVELPDTGTSQEIITIDVTPDVSQWLVNGQPNYGWFFVYISGAGYKTAQIQTSDQTYQPDLRHPKLTVDYTEGGIFIPAKIGAIAGKGTLTPLASV